MILCSALLSLLLSWGVVVAEGSNYCMDQPAGMEALERKAVTLPCQYSYPRELRPVGRVTTIWKTGQANTCSDIIFSHTGKPVNSSNTNQFSLVGDPEGDQTLSIQITNLTESDSKRYCCRVHLLKPNSTEILQGWENPQGTLLAVRGSTRLRGYQLDSIPAMKGDSISIPCKYTYADPLDSTQSVIIEWSNGTDPKCGNHFFQPPNASNSGINGIFQDMSTKGNQTIFLRLYHLQTSDSKGYCCRVRVAGQHQIREEWTRPYGTRLIIGSQSNDPEYNVVQPDEASVSEGETVTMSCTFNHSQAEEPYWVGIYWRVKLDLMEFIYHPEPELIHASYRGRTQQIQDKGHKGFSSLTLQNVTRSDNQTFYCLVEFRICRKGINNIVPIIKEGNGTRLTVAAGPKSSGGTSMVPVFIGVGVLGAVAMALAAILFFTIRKKGQKSQGDKLIQNAPSQRSDDETENMASDFKGAQFNEKATPEVDSDNIVYASLDLDTSTKNTIKTPQEQETETVYAAVRASR